MTTGTATTAGTATGAPVDRGRIDTHQHLVPPRYRDTLDRLGLDAGGWPLPAWDADTALSVMDEESIAVGILSLSAPGAHVTDDDTDGRTLAREVNEFGAELVKDRPDRFGLFATLPLPDVDGALAELAHAHDVLRADGVVLLSNAGGRYLGDPRFEPLWAELAARATVVFVHPTEPVGLSRLPGLPGPLVDYPFDTTRTAVHMLANGVLQRHPDLRIILSHGGGFLPYAAYRMVAAAQFTEGVTAETMLTDARKFWFDTALSATPSALPSLLAWADPVRITFGSDHPFAPSSRSFNQVLDTYDMSSDTRHAINRGNAETLFPRLS